jgi:hypothetical protein
MKNFISITVLFILFPFIIHAQKIIAIEHNGKKYEVLDMTSKGKIMWGGYEEIVLDAAKSETDGSANTKQLLLRLERTVDLMASLTQRNFAARQKMEGRKTGTCHQKLKLKLFMGLKINLMLKKKEPSGLQRKLTVRRALLFIGTMVFFIIIKK